MFFGPCTLHPVLRQKESSWRGEVPPAFYKYARTLEVSLSPDFPKQLFCREYDVPGEQGRHGYNDFHWLHLDRFKSLRRVDIWIAARSTTVTRGSEYDYVGIKELDADALRDNLAVFKQVEQFTLSTPLSSRVGPKDDGPVEGIFPSNFLIYKRGTGDRFHPFLRGIYPGGPLEGVIHTHPQRYVRMTRLGCW